MPNIPAIPTNSAKKMAQAVARQIAQEPLEILKTASSQITGEETPKPQESYSQPQSGDAQAKIIRNQQELQDKIKSSRRMEAFQRELDDIRKQDLFRDLQEKISQGFEIPLTDYPDLSMEQKQVLKAQMEAVRFQKQQMEYAESQGGGPLFGSSKKGRRMGSNQKQEAEKQQTRVEKPVPPSG